MRGVGTSDNILCWDDIDACATQLAENLGHACGVADFDRVIGIARGGLIPAVLLATKLGVKRLETVQVRYYDGDQKLEAPIVLGEPPKPHGPSGDPARTLLVDELIDSGATLRHLRALFPEAHRAALVGRQTGPLPGPRAGLIPWINDAQAGADRPVWVGRAIATTQWILVPWSSSADVEAGATPS